MPDVPFPKPEPEPDPDMAAKLVLLRNRIDDAAHVALTGDTTSRIRRKALFIIAEVGTVVAIAAPGPIGLIVGVLGLIALLSLAMTDEVVDLG